MRVSAIVVLLGSCFVGLGYGADKEEPGFQRLFHLAGIPGVEREARVDLVPGSDALVFQTRKVRYEVPYARIRDVLLLSADRRYEGATYAAAVATPGAGAFLILKKHHVDTAVLNYSNDRGGQMGIVVQMERSQGEHLKKLLTGKGVRIGEPGDPAGPGSKESPGIDATERSKQ